LTKPSEKPMVFVVVYGKKECICRNVSWVIEMMNESKEKQNRLMVLTMESLVPEDHFLRKLDAGLDLGFIYELCRPLYSQAGRPSIDPVVLVKMLLLGYLYGINSERRLEKEIQVNIAYRWYLGLDLEDRVPDHSTLSQNRRRRFKGTAVFEDIFTKVVQLCMDAGLVEGKAIVMDSTHVRANVDDHKQEVVVVEEEPREYLRKLDKQIQEIESKLYAEKSKCGPKATPKPETYKRKGTKSITDPDSGLLGRPGKPGGFHYLCHQSADIKHGIITDVHVTAGNRLDHECCVERIRSQRQRLHLPVQELAADKGYDCIEVHHELGEMGISVYTPQSRPHEGYRRNTLAADRFTYDKEQDLYHCPGGYTLHFSYYEREKEYIFALYRSRAKECRSCPLRQECFSATSTVRKIKRSLNTEHMEENRKRIGTERYRYLQRRRRVICEGNFANMKDNGNLRRTRKRGSDNVKEHCLLCAIALNLKKLIKLTGGGCPRIIHGFILSVFMRLQENLRRFAPGFSLQ
jgi:transposase